MIAALLLIGILSGVVLVFVYNYSMPKIEVNIREETRRAIKNIFPGAAEIEDIKDERIFGVKGSGGSLLGYAFIAEGNGYQGVIKLMAGTDADISVVKGIEILESQETPGLGAEIASEKFRGQFKGLSLEMPIEYIKNKRPERSFEIEAVTGATISSRSVVAILNSAVAEVREILKK